MLKQGSTAQELHLRTSTGCEMSSRLFSAVEEEQKRCALKLPFSPLAIWSIRCVDELSDLLKGELKYNLVMHRTKCTALITGVLENHVLRIFAHKTFQTKPYRYWSMSRQDISVRKLVCVSVSYYYSPTAKKITTTFLHLVETEDGKADTIYNAVHRHCGRAG
ncbi:hypothetical protein HPB48_013517 [Haemaphysalis longicornis]|uniref:Uncharacterized protein n=1 Tax=Haemaphysalis longicornis TaxID=44386 RepID=A0A9J6FYQ4_HAELO|nr:hypothetical protein HPB48_013517 [Haemaphysalis longicornis]